VKSAQNDDDDDGGKCISRRVGKGGELEGNKNGYKTPVAVASYVYKYKIFMVEKVKREKTEIASVCQCAC